MLALLSIALTAGNVVILKTMSFGHDIFVIRMAAFITMKVFATTASIAIFFLIYWLLPNGKVPARAVIPAAIIMGFLLEILKYSYIWALPRLNFQEVYGPFALSVSLMLWAFLSGMLLLTGAHLSARKIVRRIKQGSWVLGLRSWVLRPDTCDPRPTPYFLRNPANLVVPCSRYTGPGILQAEADVMLYSLKRKVLRQVSRLPGSRLLWSKVSIGSLETRVFLGVGAKPMYRFGIYSKAALAKLLGLPGISSSSSLALLEGRVS